jgi:hypothetical protein
MEILGWLEIFAKWYSDGEKTLNFTEFVTEMNVCQSWDPEKIPGERRWKAWLKERFPNYGDGQEFSYDLSNWTM